MPHQIEIKRPGGAVHVVSMAGDSLVLGSGAAADVMLQAEGLEGTHLRFVRTDAGVRVEPVRPGGIVAVNGEELFCKDLANGDVIAVAGLELRWLADRTPPTRKAAALAAPVAPAAPSPVAPRAARPQVAPQQPARQEKRPVTPRRRSGGGNGVAIAVVFVLALVGAFVAYKVLSGSTWPNSPQDYVDLAREQLKNNHRERAKDTLDFALRGATGKVREDALALQAELQRFEAEAVLMPKVLQAQQEHDAVLAFATRYLNDAPTRPAARELVRMCDRWLANHRAICATTDDGKRLLRTVEDQRGRFTAIAGLAEPDTAADVLFAASSRMRFQWRDYRGAFAALDGYLAVHPDDAAVLAERAKMLREGEEWLRGKMQRIDTLLARGDVDGAASDLKQAETWSMLPQWEPLVRDAKAKLPAR